ncbi:flagellar protein FlaG [Clostridium beijerinckii]|uniref:Flagellar protein FlaG n=1 Tax=Clostridium beijerinckii TaxID=1520 RepID=A0AAE5LNU2_CLOBE|nr:flagellar protein FlaG [Clostridium beijerinckii]NSB12947.1 flagellar protein FlaG [Clostridium beijerinckii]OOM28246.1 flagellar protein FlaG [Clostridium beijerinckii]
MDINSVLSINNGYSYQSDNIQDTTNDKKNEFNKKIANDEYANSKIKNTNKDDVEKALKKLNKFLEDEPVHAEYSVHKDLNVIMIKIVDDTTKQVIMEIPSEKILDMVASMCKQVGLIDKKA